MINIVKYIFQSYCNLFNEQNLDFDIFSVVSIAIAMFSLSLSVYQGYLSRQALKLTRKSIDDDIRSRQLINLSHSSWAINVLVKIEIWIGDVTNLKNDIVRAINENNDTLLSKVASRGLNKPSDVRIMRFDYDKMPSALREIMMSGAQYYYDAMASTINLLSKNRPDWKYAHSIIERYDESLIALRQLRFFISDIVPDIILNTPASISDSEFLV